MEAYIKDIAYYLPEKIVTNEDLAREFPEWSAEKIFNKVGIFSRHIAADDETAADMAEKAAGQLFRQGICRDDVDFVIFCTQSPDYKLPSSACILQNRLGLGSHVGAFDFNLGCSGYVYGLSVAKGLILGNMAKNVLLLTGETYSKYIDASDKGNRTIFGDAATATLISSEGKARIGDFVFGTDGSGFDDLIVPNGGARNMPGSHNTVEKPVGNADSIFMDGGDIFAFTLKQVPKMIDLLLQRNNTSRSDVSLYVLHQANKYMLDFLQKKMKLEDEKMYVNIGSLGNTVSNTIPIALRDAEDSRLIKSGDNVVLAGFGVGLSWAGVELFY